MEAKAAAGLTKDSSVRQEEEVLSLEEILAEGMPKNANQSPDQDNGKKSLLSKSYKSFVSENLSKTQVAGELTIIFLFAL